MAFRASVDGDLAACDRSSTIAGEASDSAGPPSIGNASALARSGRDTSQPLASVSMANARGLYPGPQGGGRTQRDPDHHRAPVEPAIGRPLIPGLIAGEGPDGVSPGLQAAVVQPGDEPAALHGRGQLLLSLIHISSPRDGLLYRMPTS